MYEGKWVVFTHPRKFGELEPDRQELYWRGKPCVSKAALTTRLLTKAAQFDSADDARAAVNTMVNLGLVPEAVLDMRIGKRMIVDENTVYCAEEFTHE